MNTDTCFIIYLIGVFILGYIAYRTDSEELAFSACVWPVVIVLGTIVGICYVLFKLLDIVVGWFIDKFPYYISKLIAFLNKRWTK